MADLVQQYVDEYSKNELIDMADEHELDTDGNKDDIARRIVAFETGVPVDDVSGEPEEAEEAPEPVSVQEEDTQDDEPEAAEPTGDEVLVYFVGKSLQFETGGYSFGRNNPFRAIPEEDADAIFEGPDGELFRTATPAQAREFYS